MTLGRFYPLPLLALCLVCTLSAPHDPLLAQPAVFDEPSEHYYKAKGIGIVVKWEVPRTTVQEGRDLTVTLVITRVMNPTEVVKPDLRKLPAFNDAFIVTDEADPPPKPTDKEVRFKYKLRPRNRSVDQVPALEFYYFNPAAPPGKKAFPQARADAVSITVTEPPPKPAIPMTEEDRLFHVATGPEVLHTPFVPCRWAWVAAALLGPLAAVVWFFAWRRIYPDAARLAHLRRSRAARRATDAIQKASRTPDPPATIAAAVLGYLRTRFPLPESAVTPSEIAVALVDALVPEEVAEQIADVFRACDRARFAPPSDSGLSIASDAEAVISRLEAIA